MSEANPKSERDGKTLARLDFLHRMEGWMIVSVVVVLGGIIGAMFGIPAYSRYQRVQDATNAVTVATIEIQKQTQMVEVENKMAEVRIADARGIASAQKIIDSSLTPNYLQYLAIEAQKAMANGPNHTEIYIPSGTNGIPLVRTVNPSYDDSKVKERE